MTHTPKPTPVPSPLSVMSVYATSLGLFAPGALMAARLAAFAAQSQTTPSQG